MEFLDVFGGQLFPQERLVVSVVGFEASRPTLHTRRAKSGQRKREQSNLRWMVDECGLIRALEAFIDNN